MHYFWDIRLQKSRDLENRIRSQSRSLEISPYVYDFLLIFYSNYNYRNRQFFPPPCIYSPAEGVTHGIGSQVSEKNYNYRLLDGRKSFKVI